MTFAAVVCTRDRPAQLERSLAALAGALRDDDERIVVDSASVDAAAVASVAVAAGFRVVRAPVPGLSRARNAALEATGADVVAFTDDDCTVDDGWSAALAAPFADPDVGFVTGPVLADRAARLQVAVDPRTERRAFGAGADPNACGHGANMAFRRAAIVDVGGFDPELGAGARLRAAEDTDAFWKLLAAGWHGVFEPEARVTHEQWRSTGEALRTSFGYGIGLGAMSVKGIRRRQAGAWRVLGRAVWHDGLARGARQLRDGYESGAASCWVRTAGTVVGAAKAVRTR